MRQFEMRSLGVGGKAEVILAEVHEEEEAVDVYEVDLDDVAAGLARRHVGNTVLRLCGGLLATV